MIGRGSAEHAVLLLGFGILCGIIITATCALRNGSRSAALISFLLATLPFWGFAFGLWRVLFWVIYAPMWFVGLFLSVVAMIQAYWPRGETPPTKPSGGFLVISALIGFAMLLFFCCGSPMFNHTPVDPSLEREIKRGMTKAEVEAILGPPSQGGHSGVTEVWSYYVRGDWGVTFLISFDQQGNVRLAHESDGW